MTDQGEPKSSMNVGGRIITIAVLLTMVWVAAGTEWTLAFEKEGFLRGLVIEDPNPSEEGRCEATIDFTGLPARPTGVVVRFDSGDEPLALENGRGTISYPRGPTSMALRLTFVGALHKPSHADIVLAQSGCRLQPQALETMPLLPF